MLRLLLLTIVFVSTSAFAADEKGMLDYMLLFFLVAFGGLLVA
jgi:hypothetical protein